MWISLIQREPDRIAACSHILEQAQKGDVELWTSAFTLAEVVKRRCGDGDAALPESDDDAFGDYLEQEFVQTVQVDFDLGRAARRLLRKYPSIRKPQDAVHVATALLENVDELHTFDHKDLLKLDGKIQKEDGTYLAIKTPQPPPPPAQADIFRDHDWDDENEPAKDHRAG